MFVFGAELLDVNREEMNFHFVKVKTEDDGDDGMVLKCNIKNLCVCVCGIVASIHSIASHQTHTQSSERSKFHLYV